jgi:hypothetical protein
LRRVNLVSEAACLDGDLRAARSRGGLAVSVAEDEKAGIVMGHVVGASGQPAGWSFLSGRRVHAVRDD